MAPVLKAALKIIPLVVDAVQVSASFFRLLITPVYKNPVAVVRPVHAFSDSTRQNTSPLDICIGSTVYLLTGEEGHKTYTFLSGAWILVVNLVLFIRIIKIIKVIKVAASFTSLLIAAVCKNTVAVVWSVHALCGTTRQNTGPLDICIGSTPYLITAEEGHKTYEVLVVALISIVEACKVSASITCLAIAAVVKNTASVVWPIQALCGTQRQYSCPLHVYVSASPNLITSKKGNKTDLLLSLAPGVIRWLIALLIFRLIIRLVPTLIFIEQKIGGHLMIVIGNSEVEIEVGFGFGICQ